MLARFARRSVGAAASRLASEVSNALWSCAARCCSISAELFSLGAARPESGGPAGEGSSSARMRAG